jgi:hypothetical protein
MSESAQRYRDVSSEALNAKAAKVCEVSLLPNEEEPVDIVVRGCPSCEHDATWNEPVFVVRGIDVNITGDLARAILAGFRAAGRPVTVREVTARCQCNHPHPGAPKGVKGCGCWWSLKVQWGN